MARYQLFRTSPSLSGQVRLDIIVNKDPKTQTISGNDIHIVPISDSIDFNESNKRNTLRYTHPDNIKNLYRETKDSFYDISGEYSEDSWLYGSTSRKDPYSHTYMAGPRRMRYSRYDKQFSYMIPLWISEYTDFSKLRFVCHAGTGNQDVILSTFGMSPEIVKYLQDYMDSSDGETGISDDLINIDLKNFKAYIRGVQASTGQYATKDISYITRFLIMRERPMMELDSVILDMFRQNNMIAKQILNFNIVFDIRDISGAWPEYWLYNKKIQIWIDVQYDGVSLEYKDLYTNYEFIPKYDISAGSYTSDNVLDMMEDYKCIDLVKSNKFVQPIFHWALADNPDYMFNLYSGCAPYIGKNMTADGGSFDWIDLSLAEPDEWKQNWKWVKYNDYTGVTGWDIEFDDLIAYWPDKIDTKFTKIKNNSYALSINSNVFRKYYDDEDAREWSPIWESGDNCLNNKEFWLSFVTDPNMFDPNTDSSTLYKFKLWKIGDTYAMVIICRDIAPLVLYRMCYRNVITPSSGPYDGKPVLMLLNDLYSFFQSSTFSQDDIDIITNLFLYITGYGSESGKTLLDRWVAPDMIEFTDSLNAYSKDTMLLGEKPEEFKYVKTKKSDTYYRYMFRYSGNIIPFFIDLDDNNFYNEFYRFYQWDNSRSDIMRKCADLKNKNIPMSYPSIVLGEDHGKEVSYYPWIKDGDYNHSDFYNNWNTDIFWGRHNRLWNLPPTVKFQVTAQRTMSPEEITELIWAGFIQALRDMSDPQDCPLADTIDAHEQEFKNFINKNYEIEQNFEYASLYDIDNIIYTVTYKLR